MKTSRRRASFLSRRRRPTAHLGGSQPKNRRLRFETLEDRRMLAVITVNTPLDTFDGSINDGNVSIRDAVHAANNLFDIDTINFDPAVFATPQTIFLTQALG